jgi:ABC-2 type transport system ATP-binding protein
MAGLPARQRVDELIDQAGLSAARRRRIGEFSKGMARRVGLAQALLNDPDLVLLDEPTSGLDPIAGRQVKDLLLALARRGKTVLVCSHHLADMQDVCSRVAILIDGRICAHGPVPDLLRQSDTLRLTLPAMPPEKLAAVLGFIERETGAAPRVDQAERTLEALFVEVVTHRPPAP